MADYYPVLTRAIAALDQNTADTRRAVYERARQAIVKQLRSYDPPLSESEITKERLGLEEAVRRIEAENRAAQQPPKPAAPPISTRMPPPPPPSAPISPPMTTPPRSLATPQAPSPSAPPPPLPASARMGGEGLMKVHAAAAAAASLGAATANAQVSASTTRAAFETPPPRPIPQRTEPNFERPRVPGPLPPERRSEPPFAAAPSIDPELEDPNPHLREPEDPDMDRPRAPAIGGFVAIILILAIGIGAYLWRDQISAMLGGAQTAATDTGPKVDDRVTGTETVPGTIARDPAPAAPPDQTVAAPSEPAPTAPSADSGNLVSQRAILYDEAPDQKGGAAANGAVVWRTEPSPDNPSQIRLVGEATIADRGLTATMIFTRNTDETLAASHLIEIKFDTSPDFQNGGVANVPGILFKPSEDAGGSALKGMSVKVTKNLFWIGLEKAPADREQNMQAIRTRGWIDLPILYENGRRAVLTIEKGPPGERAFETAFATWDAQATATPAAQPETPSAPQLAPILPP